MNPTVPIEITPRQLKEKFDAGETVQLVDVREPREYAVARIEGAELIPMGTVPQALASLREKSASGALILYCHHGVRSLQAVNWLRRQGLAACMSLAGGIDRWSVAIDPSVPRY